MNRELLLTHFNRISDAPDAIPRLRRFILDLAVRGKLVEQDPHEEPASELLQRIQVEKTRLVKTGEIKKQKQFSLIERNEAPFGAPPGWEWTRIRQVTSDRGQTTPTKDFTYIDVTAINKEAGCVAEAKILTPAEAPSRARKSVKTGDVLYSCVRPYLLNVAVIQNEMVPAPIASTAFAVLNGFGLVLSKYLWIALRSPFMVECVEAKMRGQAYPAINDSDFAELPFPLPPLAEQHRIVAKVAELMALCDRLEAVQRERESRRDRLAAASHHHLNNGVDAVAFRNHAQLYLSHLPRFTARPDEIKQLRQTILNLAVRGKLVLQVPHDEPAVALLKRIQAEKALLLEKGVIHRLLPVSPIATDQIPSAIPSSWKWVRIGDLLLGDSQNGYSRKPDDAADGIPILRISAGTVRKDGVVAEEEHKLIGGVPATQQSQYELRPGDLLACRFNGNQTFVGRLSLYLGYLGIKPIYPDKLIRLRLIADFVLPKLVRYFAESDIVRKDIQAYCATTVGNWGISASNLKEVKIPLPPFPEQKRIVAKLDELLAVCDQLEEQLTTTQSETSRLLESVLHHASSNTSLPNPHLGMRNQI